MGWARLIDSGLGIGLGPCNDAERVLEWEDRIEV